MRRETAFPPTPSRSEPSHDRTRSPCNQAGVHDDEVSCLVRTAR